MYLHYYFILIENFTQGNIFAYILIWVNFTLTLINIFSQNGSKFTSRMRIKFVHLSAWRLSISSVYHVLFVKNAIVLVNHQILHVAIPMVLLIAAAALITHRLMPPPQHHKFWYQKLLLPIIYPILHVRLHRYQRPQYRQDQHLHFHQYFHLLLQHLECPYLHLPKHLQQILNRLLNRLF